MLYPTLMGRAVRYHGSKIAFHDGEQKLTYIEWASQIERIAAGLKERGIKPGDRVAFHIQNLPVFLELLFACWRIGAVAVPLNTRYSAAECGAAINDSAPALFFRQSTLPLPDCTVASTHVVDQEPLEQADASSLPPPFHDPQALAALFYTSGTTGGAKGVMLTHSNLLHQVTMYNQVWSEDAFRVLLHVAPLFHIAALPTALFGVSTGSRHVFHPRFDPAAVVQAFEKEAVGGVVLIPTMLNAVTLHPDLARTDVSSLKAITYGGSAISPSTVERARACFPGVPLMQGYGMTETTGAITVLFDEDNRGKQVLSCGKPLFGSEVKIVDLNARPVAVGESGELCVRGPLVMRGYWNKREATAQALRDGWLHTGDVAREDEEGFVYIVDRLKDMIVTGGENVYSVEVETAISSHPAVREVAVYGIPDSQWGEAVAASVSLKADCLATAEELLEHCRKQVAGYKVPRRLEIVDGELPKSGTNKILKRVLRERFWAGQGRRVGGAGGVS